MELCLPKGVFSIPQASADFLLGQNCFWTCFGWMWKATALLVFLSIEQRRASPSSALAHTGSTLACLRWILCLPISSFLHILIYHLGTCPPALLAFPDIQGRDWAHVALMVDAEGWYRRWSLCCRMVEDRRGLLSPSHVFTGKSWHAAPAGDPRCYLWGGSGVTAGRNRENKPFTHPVSRGFTCDV